jgi:hypothetical protein
LTSERQAAIEPDLLPSALLRMLVCPEITLQSASRAKCMSRRCSAGRSDARGRGTAKHNCNGCVSFARCFGAGRGVGAGAFPTLRSLSGEIRAPSAAVVPTTDGNAQILRAGPSDTKRRSPRAVLPTASCPPQSLSRCSTSRRLRRPTRCLRSIAPRICGLWWMGVAEPPPRTLRASPRI